MMIDLLRNRRSIRQFENQPVEKEKVEILKEALLRSPSSRNFQPWHFILVDDAVLLNALSQAKPRGAVFLKDAPLGIVICGDETRSDVWVEDCSIASILVQITAESLGLGSCWIQIRKRNHESGQTASAQIQKILGLPSNLHVESIIALGVPAEEKSPHPAEDLPWNKIYHNQFSE